MPAQLQWLLDKVQLGRGVAMGLWASQGAHALDVDVAFGIARVGSLDNDPAITNKASYGMNQPGRVLQFGGATVTLVGDGTHFVWLKTDGSLAATAFATDPNDVAPELGPDPFKGEMLAHDQQRGPLRRREAASVLLASVQVVNGAIIAIDNTVRSQVLI